MAARTAGIDMHEEIASLSPYVLLYCRPYINAYISRVTKDM